ncbi:MAG TPA: hypothetical protein VG454_13600 [Gemmatimonadales bacterium]|nr:hypothetical protein [Gemmatimonadales bacterium]
MRPMSLAVLASMSLTVTAVAQQPKPVTDPEQVATAVSGSSRGGPVYEVICDNAGAFKIIGAYTTATQAQQVAAAKGVEHRTCFVEGPYSPGDSLVTSYGAGCKKGPDSECISDTSRVFVAPLEQIDRVDIVYHMKDRRTVTESFDPRKVEAIFFTMPAVDRMLMPYDVQRYGFDGAVRRRREIEARFGRR